jgi:hypothetical protein
MEITEAVLLEIWELFSDYIAVNKRNDVAAKFLQILVEHEIEPDDLETLRGEDEHLDYALDEINNNEGDYDNGPDYEED